MAQTSSRMTEPARGEGWLELISTVLLALATVATAWSAYQARQWTGEQSQGYSKATATRIEENRVAALADRQVQIDVATFIQWVDAREAQTAGLADFYRSRFREEFKPAFAAWLATDPFEDTSAPRTPFDVPEYKLAASEKAERLELAAAASSELARKANERADNYMLAVVLFATTLFFAGISVKLRNRRARIVILGLGCALFLGTVIWILTFPVQLTT